MLFRIQDLSNYLNVSASTIYKWTAKNEILFIKIRGLLRFKKEDIDQWIEKFHYKDRGYYGLKSF
jgi:excisionase family DNA binding protein